ncbi:MAG: D-cysteine desulfhydrase family protein [Actinomycetia bacterium]|nr:D-cysteine desulfhydrase family protein [Actinomycetes bacterium]
MSAATPLVRLERLGEALEADVWIKRDDLGETGLGGNKLRKLEFLLGDALASGCDTVVTFGAVQSNHARQTAAAAARCGLTCHALLTRTVPRDDALYNSGGNLLLDGLFGADVRLCDPDSIGEAAAELEAELASSGANARWIAPGGSEPIGVLGYVAAGRELVAQASRLGLVVDDVVVANGTGGTQAGLLCGTRTAGADSPPAIRGVAVLHPAAESVESVTLLDAGVSELIGVPHAPAATIEVDGAQLGEGYGVPTDAMREALALFARTEGIALDPVYTGKAAASLVARCRSGELGNDGAVVMVHTGGTPGLFAYGDDVLQ